MNVSAKPPVFRIEKTTGFATMADLRRAALWLGDVLNLSIVIEGVTHVSPVSRGVFIDAAPVSSTNKAGGLDVTPKRPVFRFKRSKGMALFSDLEAFAEFVRVQLSRRMESNDFISAGAAPGLSNVTFKMNPNLI